MRSARTIGARGFNTLPAPPFIRLISILRKNYAGFPKMVRFLLDVSGAPANEAVKVAVDAGGTIEILQRLAEYALNADLRLAFNITMLLRHVIDGILSNKSETKEGRRLQSSAKRILSDKLDESLGNALLNAFAYD